MIKSETGLSSPKLNSLLRLEGLTGVLKMGRNDFEREPKYRKGIFYSHSKEKINYEYSQFFIYILSSKELEEIEAGSNIIRDQLGFDFLALEKLLTNIDTESHRSFASTILQLFKHPDNREVVMRRIQGQIISILQKIINDKGQTDYDPAQLNEF